MASVETREQHNMHEKCDPSIEKRTMEEFSTGLANIGREYTKTKKDNPQEAKAIAKRQIQELKDRCSAYKILSGGQKNPSQTKMEQDLRDAQALLSEWTDKTEIMRILYANTSYTGDDIGSLKENNTSLLLFLPEEYRQNGEINKDIVQSSIEADRLREMEEFLTGKRVRPPYFDNNDFTKHPDIITKALSKPRALLGIYEMLRTSARNGDGNVTKNPDFVKTVNDILAREYPDFFGVAINTEWYKGDCTTPPWQRGLGGFDFNKIATLLDIVNYAPAQKKDFLTMMNDAENGKSETAVDIYEKRFIGTPIEEDIRSYFPESKLLKVSLLEESQKTLDTFQKTHAYKKGGVLDIIENNEESKKFAQASFMYIPTDHLNIFLSLLPKIESQCDCGNTEALTQEIDRLDIDAIYKMRFFCGLADALDRAHSESADIAFYKRIEKRYEDNVDVTEEHGKLSEHETSGRELQYGIISRAFPGMKEEELRQKNTAFGNFLDSVAVKGKINVTRDGIIDQLHAIFSGTPEADKIFNTIKNSRNGQEVFQLLADSFTEKRVHQEKCAHDAGVDTDKWKKFQKEKRKDSVAILRTLRDPNISTEEKARILKQIGVVSYTEIPTDPEERKKFLDRMNQAIELLPSLDETAQNTATFAKENFKDFSVAWQSEFGDFTQFNKKVQERKDEAQRQEDLRQWILPSSNINTAQFMDFQSFSADFANMNTGKIIITSINGNEVIIKKDSADEVSLFSGGIPIREIRVSDQKHMNEHIEKAMDSVQFLKDFGLDALSISIPNIVDIINNRSARGSGTKIDLSDGVSVEEQYTLMSTLAKLANIEVPEGTPATRLDILKNNFRIVSQGDGIISRLRKAGYIKEGSNAVDVFAVREGVKNMP